MIGPTLSRIEIFPVKSLDGMTLQDVTVLPSGALKGDRQYAIQDAEGQFVNGKRNPLVHRLRATFSEDLSTIRLKVQGDEVWETFELMGDHTPLETWLSHYFNEPVTVQENTVTGFPDDPEALGPTIITTATLNTVAEWFPELNPDEMRRRFRTNLELADAPAFWEDQLYGKPGYLVSFQIGSVRLLGVNPCQRCIVPTRNSLDGVGDSSAPKVRHFQQRFVQSRKADLPAWANRKRFNHFYKLAVNTRLAPDNRVFHLKRGDECKVSA